MLNLRSVHLRSNKLHSSLSTSLAFSDPRFASSLVGNIGAPIAFAVPAASARGAFDDDDDDMEETVIHEVSEDPLMTGIVMEMD